MDDFRLQSQSARSKRWSVAFSAALMNLMQTGAFFFTPTTLMPLLVADFGLDLAVSTVPIAVGKIAYVVLLIPGGVLVDMYGPRRCVIGGLAGIAFFLSCYALLARSFTHVLIAHVALATASSVSGVPVYSLFIAQWFRDGVGLAMGLVLAGYSAAGATVPAILGPIATEYGWRAAMACTAVVLWVVAIPVAVAFLTENHDDDDDGSGSETLDIRVDESELPHSPPGEATPLVQPRDAVQNNANIPDPPAEHTASVGDRTASPVLRSLTQNTPIERRKVDNKSWTFVGFALNYMLLQYAFGAFGENILFFLTIDRGFSLSLASLFFSCLNLASFTAKLVGGHLGDRYDRFHVASATSAVAAFGVTLMYWGGGIADDNVPRLTSSPLSMILFACVFGFGYGATFNSLYVLVPITFGRQNLGKIQSSLFGLGLAGNAVGSIATGVLRSKYGTYDRPFLVAGVACFTNLLVFNVTRLSLGGSMAGLRKLAAETEPVVPQEVLDQLEADERALQNRIGSLGDTSSAATRGDYASAGTSSGMVAAHSGSSFFGASFADTQLQRDRRGAMPRTLSVTDNPRFGPTSESFTGSLASPRVSSDHLNAAASFDTGVQFDSGFPYARDWSYGSLTRFTRPNQHRVGGIRRGAGRVQSTGLVRASSTVGSLLESGVLSKSMEDIGYVGNSVPQAVPIQIGAQVSESPDGSTGGDDVFAQSPLARSFMSAPRVMSDYALGGTQRPPTDSSR